MTEKTKTYHCFFERSGTFKNEFKKLGYHALDYDILNDFGETDVKIDLFNEIEKAYGGGSSIFDTIMEGDEIMAFFPCVRFEDQIVMSFAGNAYQMQKWSDTDKLLYDMKLHKELHDLYCTISKLAIVCLRKKIPTIIENPKGQMHYLSRYWALKPKLIDYDRSERGDYYKKPTQYWFINRDPSNNFIFEEQVVNKRLVIKHLKGSDRQVKRSLISKDYANRFIREFVI